MKPKHNKLSIRLKPKSVNVTQTAPTLQIWCLTEVRSRPAGRLCR